MFVLAHVILVDEKTFGTEAKLILSAENRIMEYVTYISPLIMKITKRSNVLPMRVNYHEVKSF